MTPAQHTALARLSDGEWRLGYDIATSPVVLSALDRAGYIRSGIDGHVRMERLYTITPTGLLALDVHQ
ncbi:hypothetical protein [Yoonia sp.]|uniref:hypothetical protein n=1 Tax=Yoonia sp. TaxID=2212373 RepID=UPI002E05BAD5|nr:hypothetical protein [Yoonia sp.]